MASQPHESTEERIEKVTRAIEAASGWARLGHPDFMKRAGVLFARRSALRAVKDDNQELVTKDRSIARWWLERWGRAASRPAILLDLKDRYLSASTELNQRMAQRHSSYLGFAAATAGFIDLLSKSEATHTLVVFPSVICFAFSAWIRSQDLTVGLLSAYCRVCESWDEDYRLPAFYSEDQGWWKRAMRHREWMELSFVAIAFVLIESPVVLKFGFRPPQELVPWFCLNQFVFGFCSWMILSIRLERYRMFDIEIVPIVNLKDNKDDGSDDEVYFGINENSRDVPKTKSIFQCFCIFGLVFAGVLAAARDQFPSHVRWLLWPLVLFAIGVKLWSATVECCYLETVVDRGRKQDPPKWDDWWSKAFSARTRFMVATLGIIYFENSNIHEILRAHALFYAFWALPLDPRALFVTATSLFNPSSVGSFATLMIAGYATPEMILTFKRRKSCADSVVVKAFQLAAKDAKNNRRLLWERMACYFGNKKPLICRVTLMDRQISPDE